jgi:hypothetical protein
MARPIKPTPVLDPKSTKVFLRRIDSNQGTKTGPVPTPKLSETLKRFADDAVKKE